MLLDGEIHQATSFCLQANMQSPLSINKNNENSYIFILGHIRAHTTLLAHILGSNPEISGYLELFQSYKTQEDLVKMSEKLQEFGGDQTARYLLDKIVFDSYKIDPELLNREDVYPIFIIRRPAETMNSAMGLSFGKDQTKRFFKVLNIYLSRLRTLTGYARSLARPGLFIDAEQLLDDTSSVFHFLENQLGLKTPLREEYSLFTFSGFGDHGDPSGNILAGKIDRERTIPLRMVLSPDMMEILDQAYRECRNALVEKCYTISSDTKPLSKE